MSDETITEYLRRKERERPPHDGRSKIDPVVAVAAIVWVAVFGGGTILLWGKAPVTALAILWPFIAANVALSCVFLAGAANNLSRIAGRNG
jgi:hypothetical protein